MLCNEHELEEQKVNILLVTTWKWRIHFHLLITDCLNFSLMFLTCNEKISMHTYWVSYHFSWRIMGDDNFLMVDSFIDKMILRGDMIWFLWNLWFFASNIVDVLSTFNAMGFSTFTIMHNPNKSRWIQITYKLVVELATYSDSIVNFVIGFVSYWTMKLLPLLVRKYILMKT